MIRKEREALATGSINPRLTSCESPLAWPRTSNCLIEDSHFHSVINYPQPLLGNLLGLGSYDATR